MRLFYLNVLLTLLSVLCIAMHPACAQDTGNIGAADSISDGLSAVENKLFLHNYSGDTNDERLTRLEDMVFGKKESGTQQSRLNKITTAIGGPGVTGETPPAFESPGVAPDSTPVPALSSNDALSPNNSSSSSNNFAQRRPILAEYGLGKLPPSAPPIDTGSTTISSLPPIAPPFVSWVTNNFSSYPYSTSATSPMVPSYLGNLVSKVDYMENTLFGQTYSDPLPARVLRLEGKVFPQEPPATNLSLTERVGRLFNAVSLHPGR